MEFTSSSSSSRNKPMMFFKVYLPDYSSQQLQIPSAFVKRLNYTVPHKSVLLSYEKQTWSVGVKEVGNTLVFQNGWSDFVHGTSLEAGDFLVFTYLGAKNFKVQIYGPSTCEKNNSSRNHVKVEMEDEETVPHDIYGKTNRHVEEMYPLPHMEQKTVQHGIEKKTLVDGEQLIDQDEEEDSKLGNENYKEQLTDEEEEDSTDSFEMTDEEELSEDSSSCHEKEKEKCRKGKSTADKEHPSDLSRPKRIIWNGAGIKNKFPNVSFTSVHPHFQMGMIHVYISHGSLNVPMRFSKKYLTPGMEKADADLQVLDKSWPVKLTYYTNSDCCKISKGWLAFVRDNCIKIDDICVFELTDLNALTFRVTIFRYTAI